VSTEGEHGVLAEALARMRSAVDVVASGPSDPADPWRGLYVDDAEALRLGAQAPANELERRFDTACERLGLDALERRVLALCVAPETHADVARLYGYLHDDLTRGNASPRLVARLLAGERASEADVLGCFDERARLRATGAIRVDAAGPLIDRAVTVGSLLAARVVGANVAGSAMLRRHDGTGLPPGREPTLRRMRKLLDAGRELPLAISGPDALDLLVAASGRSLVVLDARSALAPQHSDDLALATALDGDLAVVDGLAELDRDGRGRALQRIVGLACRPILHVAGREDRAVLAEQATIGVDVPALTGSERASAWRAATGRDCAGVADRFRLDLRQIGEAAALARAEAGVRGAPELDVELLTLAARTVSSSRVGELAELLSPGPGWDSLVLPPRQLAGLRSLSSFLSNREQVVGAWGYGSITAGQGLTAMFAGESGTGKTLAARVVAGTAGLDVYRVDLAALFSKWVGETEKNLDRVFSAGEGSNAVLFFDEADVVFSKRSVVSGASDRYANLETAYLLQRIEEYDGIVVLATNLRSNVDDAFLRRINVFVDFPPPDAATRRKLWVALLPPQAPCADDVDLDFLAERFELTGGGIRNCTVSAAFLAAGEGAAIGMAHLVRAVALEYAKLGRLTLEADFERYHHIVREP